VEQPEIAATREQLGNLEQALADLRHRVYPHSPERFKLYAESYVGKECSFVHLKGVERRRSIGYAPESTST
jgi:hypothetical protein